MNLQKIEEEGVLSSLLCEANTTLIPKPGKDITRKLQTDNLHEHRCKNFKQNFSQLNPTIHKKENTS